MSSLELCHRFGVNVRTHLVGSIERRFFQAERNKVDPVVDVRFCFRDHSCGFQQTGNGAGIVVGAGLVATDVVMGSDKQPSQLLAVVRSNDVLVFRALNGELLLDRFQSVL